MDTITPEMIETVESSLREQIRHEQERIACLHKLEPLAGKYVTKRLEPDIKAMFPDYTSCYLSKDSYNGELTVILGKPGWRYWEDDFHCKIGDSDTRRVDIDRIKTQIKKATEEIERLKTLHDTVRENFMQFANLLTYAKTLASPIESACRIAMNHSGEPYKLRSLTDFCHSLNQL